MKKINIGAAAAALAFAAVLTVGAAAPANALTSCTVTNTVCLFDLTLYKGNKITVGSNNNSFFSYNDWAASIQNNRSAGTKFWDGTYQTGSNFSLGSLSVSPNLGNISGGWNDRVASSYTM